MRESASAGVGRFSALGDTLRLCIGILDRERNGRGPENPDSLKALLEGHQAGILVALDVLKKSPKMKAVHEDVLRLEELVEKFDLRSLEEARNVLGRMEAR